MITQKDIENFVPTKEQKIKMEKEKRIMKEKIMEKIGKSKEFKRVLEDFARS